MNNQDLMNMTDAPVRDVAVASESARAQAETQAMILMARRFPRDIDRSFENAMKSVKRVSFAEKAFFSFPRGGTDVKGPSINLAREFARCWGNIQYEIRVVHDDEESMTIEGRAWDLETNTVTANQASFKKLVQRKNKATGKTNWVVPDERDLRELVGKNGSIAVRNSLMQLFPKDMIDDLLEACFATLKQTVKASGSILDQAKKAVETFKSFNVTKEMMEANRGKKMEKWNEEDIATLRTAYEGIKSGQVDRDELFSATTIQQQPEVMDISKLTVKDEPKQQSKELYQKLQDVAKAAGVPLDMVKVQAQEEFNQGVLQLLTDEQIQFLIDDIQKAVEANK